MLTLAENTNGRAVVNTNGLAAGMLKITDDLSAHYLLGYYSSNTAADGRFRRIEVERSDPGRRLLRARRYLAPTEALLKAAAEAAFRPLTGPRGRPRTGAARTDSRRRQALIAAPPRQPGST